MSQCYDFTQFSQPEVMHDDSPNGGDGTGGNAKTKIVVESSSLIKVLLRVDALQPTLLTALMQKIPEVSASLQSDDDEGGRGSGSGEGDVPRLIFSNLRWLDHVVDYESLTNAYVECLTMLASCSAGDDATRGMLLDAIATLPDVLNDCTAFALGGGGRSGGADQDEDEDCDMEEGGGLSSTSSNPILSTLQLLRVEDPTLLVPCLDAIGSLPLTEEQVADVTRDALEALANVEPWGLPALTTFLMNRCPSSSSGKAGRELVREVVEEMRKLPLDGGAAGDGGEEGADGGEEGGEGRGGAGRCRRNFGAPTKSSAGSSALMIESLSRGFAHRPDMTSALLKCIKETATYHPPADIWLLACACASAPHNRAKVKALFKSKASSGMFTSRLLRESLSGNGQALTSLFGTSLCDLADGLLRAAPSPSSACLEGGGGGAGCAAGSAEGGGASASDLGVTLYEILFEEFPEPMQRQEVVGSLVTHVGSGVNVKPSEVDCALRVFNNLCSRGSGKLGEEGASALRQFTPFLTSMLDHLNHMTPSQVRRLFLLLFAVGYRSGGDDVGDDPPSSGGACSDVHIVIAKHLSLAPFAMKRIGIIGTVACAVTRSAQLQERQSLMDVQNDLAETEATALPGSAAIASSPVVKEIKDMLNNAYIQCKPTGGGGRLYNGMSSAVGSAFSDGSAMAFFLDELCHAVRGGRLATPVKDWIEELILEDFENLYVGDFEENEHEEHDMQPRKGTKGAGGDEPAMEEKLVPTNASDLALLDETSRSLTAPPAELRFNIAGAESLVYVKILSLLTSHDPASRDMLPVQLSPMFRLMSTLSDTRYGGKGLSEIDAMLECPILLPSAACSGVEFGDLSSKQQWVVASSYFFATCWIRQLINSFIYAADVATPLAGSIAAGSFTSSSQGFNSDEVQKKVCRRLEALCEIEEELRFTSSKCYSFAPPGLDILPPPKELFERDDSPDADAENNLDMNANPKDLSKEEKKAIAAAKKAASKRAKERVKSKQQRLKIKKKHEEKLTRRTLGALRPLDPQVCIALGFGELSVMGNCDPESGSQGLSQFQQVTGGSQVTTLLLNLLAKTLAESLSEKKTSFKARMEGQIEEDVENDNPYMAKDSTSIANARDFADIALASCEESSKRSFLQLDCFLKNGVFASLYEHLATVAELRCGPNRKSDDAEAEDQLVETARCLFSCLRSLMTSEMLTRSGTGRSFLACILKQIAEGDRQYCADTKRRRPSAAAMTKLMGYVNDNVNEIVTGAWTGDMDFAMDGVNCMQAIFECSKRISDGSAEKDDEEGSSADFPSKLSEVAKKLLRQNWPDETKMNKGNVGKLLSLYVEHSSDRMETLSYLVECLEEVPHLGKGQGVTALPTCSHQTFGSFYSTVLENLWKELVQLFESPLGKTKDPAAASRALERVKQLIELLQSLFNLTKENDSLAKKTTLLQQLKYGSRFIETFVSKAMPFFQVHFEEHEDAVINLIRSLQKWSRQMNYIVSHGKREKDAGLAKEAPRAKKALETFVHKVKAFLKKNNCVTAMETKTLKAKDIDGTTLKEDDGRSEDEEGEGEEGSDEEGEGSDSGSEDEAEDDASNPADNSEDDYETDED